jgi:hypothetical protein
MNKQEIQTMIDSTIVPNKKKGITAESLRLVLKEMATATPEGGSGVEVLTVYGGNYNEIYEFNPDTIEAFIDDLQNEYPTLNIKGGNLHNYYLDALKNNAYVYERLIENAGKKDIICKLSVGQEVLCALKDLINPQHEQVHGFKPVDEEESCFDTQVPMSYTVFNYKYTEEAKNNWGIEDTTDIHLFVTAGGDSADITLHPDGSLSWEFIEQEATSSSDFVKRIWIDEALDLEPTEEHIAENKATYEFFKNGGDALVTLCYDIEGAEKMSLVCDHAGLLGDMFVVASASWDDNYYTHVSNTIGFSVQLDADGHIESEFKRSGYLTAYLPKDGEEYKDYNKEIYDIIKSGDVPSPIMIKAEHATYTSSIVAFENEEAIIVFVAGFDTSTGAAYMGKMSIHSDGTTAIL